MVATDRGATTKLPDGSGLVVLNTDVTPELAAAGIARDLIRIIQQARRAADLDISRRIDLTVSAPEEVISAARAHARLIATETLAESVHYGDSDGGVDGSVGDGMAVRVAIRMV